MEAENLTQLPKAVWLENSDLGFTPGACSYALTSI